MAKRFLIDRTELPYDAMVADPKVLIPIDDDEDDEEDEHEETE